MNTSFLGKTAGGLLKNAAVCKTQADTFEIFLTLPNGRQVIAMLGGRPDGWGGTATDVLVLTDSSGLVAALETSPTAYKKLRALEATREASYAQ